MANMIQSDSLRAAEPFAAGGYRYLPSVFQFSGGVAAQPGFDIERVVLHQPVPLREGLDLIQAHLQRIGRPNTAFCACELRSPGQFSEDEFRDFNRQYVRRIGSWGLMQPNDINPVARTNVCPAFDKPATPSLHSFSYTVPADGGTSGDFVVAGGAEAPENGVEYHGGIVRLGDTSLDGLREKLRYVRDEQLRRLEALGFGWPAARQVQAYCLHDVGPLVYDELLTLGVGRAGVAVHMASPPVADCVFEMDTYSVTREHVL